MKNLFLLLLLSGISFGQNVRYDAPFPSINSQTSTPFLVANTPPNSPVLSVCSSPANQVPCTNYATTFTSTGSACPNGSQDTPQPQPSACQATGDAFGNIGFWAPAGTYDYTVCVGTNCFGPYTVTLNVGTTSFPPAGVPQSTGTAWGTSLTLQGTDTSVLSSGTISGTGATLCTDSNGGATTSGCSGGGGGVSGSGTTNTIPKWTASTTLGNSSVTDNGSTVSTGELFEVTGTGSGISIEATNGSGVFIISPSTCSGTGGANALVGLPCGKALQGEINAPAGTTGFAASVLGEIANNLTWTGTPSFGGVVGNADPVGSGAINWVAGTVGVSLPATTGTTTNSSGLVGIGQASNAGATTTLDGVDAQIRTSVNVTTTTGAGLLVRSPSLTNGTVTNLSGILIQDQTGGGGLNPSPQSITQLGNAPNEFQGHLNQEASGNWAGTCTMITTSCTITLTAAYSGTPGCVVTVQGATAIAGACSVSGTTVTITAASSNTATWAAMLFGNPN